jgi:hypothetical protein
MFTNEDGTSNDMQRIAELLWEVAEAVAKLGVPDDLRAAAFQKAVDLITSPVQPAPAGRPLAGKEPAGAISDTEDPIHRVAAKLRLDPELVGEVFHVDEDGTVRLSFGPSKLDRYKSAATKQIALVLAAARQGSGQEEWTDTGAIREVTQEFGKFDPPNFASAITELADFFGFSGAGRSRRVRLNRAGYEEAARIVERIRGA